MKNRFREWLADRLPWVQYPNVLPASDNARLARPAWPLRWRFAMTIGQRLDMLLIGLFGVVVFGALLAFLLLMVWAVLFG